MSNDAKTKTKAVRTTLEERIQVVRLSSEYQKFSHFSKFWKNKFGTDPPSSKTVAGINKKFNETGSVRDLKRSGRPKSSRTPDKVSRVEDAISQDPTKSVRALALDLGINRTAVHRIKLNSKTSATCKHAENLLLKGKIAELNKKIRLLEARSSSSYNPVRLEEPTPIMYTNHSQLSQVTLNEKADTVMDTVDGNQMITVPSDSVQLFTLTFGGIAGGN